MGDLGGAEEGGVDVDVVVPVEIAYSRGNPEKSRRLLGWEAETKFAKLVPMLVEKRSFTRRKDDPKP